MNGVKELEVILRAVLVDGNDYEHTYRLGPGASIEITRTVHFAYDGPTWGKPSDVVPGPAFLIIKGKIL